MDYSVVFDVLDLLIEEGSAWIQSTLGLYITNTLQGHIDLFHFKTFVDATH